jgi:acetylornithine deacetylase/succinyl-diaminopimelate desuccinylase-like protein
MTTPPTLDLSDVFTHIDDHADTFLARLIDYVRLPSISAYGEGMEECAHYIADVMRQIGLHVKIMPTAGWPMVFGEQIIQPDLPTVLLYGHYDVQPPDPLDAWITPPFEPDVRNGRLYARGVGDNKGQHFAQLMALESLMACRGTLPCNVKVLLEGEEEVGSPHMPKFIREHQAELRSDLVIFCDGPVHENGQSTISLGVRGILNIELRAQAATRDLHSGHWGGIVPNPLWTLVHLLGTMKNPAGEITIEGFYEHVLPVSDLERAALAKLPIDIEAVKQSLGIQHLDEPQERNFFERISVWPTLTINGIHGGYGGPGTKTVLPHEAVAKCDIRLVEAQSAEDILAKVKAHVQRYAPEVSVISYGGMDPSKTLLDSPFTEPLCQALRAAQGAEPLLFPSIGASAPNYAFTRTLGIPVFTIPYANADEFNHAPNENMEIARFFMGIKSGAAMLSYLGAQ